jgi:anti-sigma factor (TIGR02949 family)
MTCQEALRLLYEVINKEASQIDAKKVKEHLHNCRDCMQRYEFEAMFQAFVTEKGNSPCKTEQLKNRILSKINDHETKPLGFFTRYKKYLFLAAGALVVFIALALTISQLYQHNSFVYPFEKSHLDNFATAIPSDNIENLTAVKNYLSSHVQIELRENIVGFKLQNAGFDEILGKKYAHLYFVKDNSHISIFVGNPSDTYLPGFSKISLPDKEIFEHVCAQCRIIYWKHNNAIIIGVTEDKNLEMASMIPLL